MCDGPRPAVRARPAYADKGTTLPSDPAPDSGYVPPKTLVLASGACFALLGVSGIVGMVAAALPIPKPAWTLFGFELVVTISSFIGLVFAKSGCRVAPAIGLACLGACIGAASLLGYLSVERALGGVSLTPFVGLRCLGAAALAGLAVIAALKGDPRSWATLFKGAIVAAPAAAGVAVFALPIGKPILNAVSNLDGFIAFILGTVVFLLLTASASAGIHLMIKSFQIAGGGSPSRPAT